MKAIDLHKQTHKRWDGEPGSTPRFQRNLSCKCRGGLSWGKRESGWWQVRLTDEGLKWSGRNVHNRLWPRLPHGCHRLLSIPPLYGAFTVRSLTDEGGVGVWYQPPPLRIETKPALYYEFPAAAGPQLRLRRRTAMAKYETLAPRPSLKFSAMTSCRWARTEASAASEVCIEAANAFP